MQCSQCLLALYHAVMDRASAENRTRGPSVKAAKRGSGKMLTSASLVLGAALVMPTQENAAVVEALGAGWFRGGGGGDDSGGGGITINTIIIGGGVLVGSLLVVGRHFMQRRATTEEGGNKAVFFQMPSLS